MRKSGKNRANLSLLGQVGRGNGKVDRRLRGFRCAKAAERRLVADLGGADAVSAQKAAVVAMAAREIALLEMLDAGLLRFPSATGKRRRGFLAMVSERDRLAAALTRHLKLLGLERQEPEPPSLEEYFAAKRAERESETNDHASESEAEENMQPSIRTGDSAGEE